MCESGRSSLEIQREAYYIDVLVNLVTNKVGSREGTRDDAGQPLRHISYPNAACGAHVKRGPRRDELHYMPSCQPPPIHHHHPVSSIIGVDTTSCSMA